MKEGEIVSRLFLEKNGKQTEIIIRFPKKDDSMRVWKFYNKVIRETEFLSRITPVTLKNEKKWIDDMLKGIKHRNKIVLFAEHDGKIVGSTRNRKKRNEDRDGQIECFQQK